VERAFSIIEMLASAKRGLTLAEIARGLDLPRSSTHYVLVTLERRGYLQRSEGGGRYIFTSKLFALANSTLSRLRIREQARPVLRALMEETGLTVHLAILDQNEAVIIEKVEPPADRLATWVGKRMPLHCTGTGKALMAYLPQAVRDQVISYGLIRYNDNTIVSVRKMNQELERIRQVEYALDDEEETVGLRCIGAAILDESRQAVAAVSIAGTVHQINSDTLKPMVEAVRRAAAALSQRVAGGRKRPS
jgi:DNA-binding IclR family transcriptional regulator